MPQLLKKEVGADRVLQHMLESIPVLLKKEIEVEKGLNCRIIKLGRIISYSSGRT
jgi:hypothetical protein